MKLLFLHKYGSQAASFRYRFQQYFPYLEKSGVKISTHSLISDELLGPQIFKGKFSLKGIVQSYWKRLRRLCELQNFDAVVVYQEVFPYLPAWFERNLLLGKTPYFIDCDDAIFHRYQEHTNPLVKYALAKKIDHLAARAQAIFAGSPYLVDYFAKFNRNTIYLPTVVDLNDYSSPKINLALPPVLGWVGSPSTSQYLQLILGPLKFYTDQFNTPFITIGAGDLHLDITRHQSHHWSKEKEIDNIKTFDVGLMPLRDDSWSRGKCGFKLIQYMACGLPGVASPIGVNRDIIEHGDTGFLATTDDEWIKAFSALASEPAMLSTMGQQGYQRVKQRFCVDVTLPQLMQALEAV